jgi:hypothetical protein
MADFSISFTGNTASRAELDFYDASRALIGFQRSLALTTHLVANGEIITQAPSLKNATIVIRPPQEGSWEIVASVLFGAGTTMVLSSKDSVLGHLTRSIYDYILNATLGIDVDFDSTIRQQYRALCDEMKITEEKLDSLAEKTEPAIVDMHRPIVWSETAKRAKIRFGSEQAVGPSLTRETFDYANKTVKLKTPEVFEGSISSYNSNTYRGRVFVNEEKRPIPFELSDHCRGNNSLEDIMNSLRYSVLDRKNSLSTIALKAFRHESSIGRLKSLYVVKVSTSTFLI